MRRETTYLSSRRDYLASQLLNGRLQTRARTFAAAWYIVKTSNRKIRNQKSKQLRKSILKRLSRARANGGPATAMKGTQMYRDNEAGRPGVISVLYLLS